MPLYVNGQPATVDEAAAAVSEQAWDRIARRFVEQVKQSDEHTEAAS